MQIWLHFSGARDGEVNLLDEMKHGQPVQVLRMYFCRYLQNSVYVTGNFVCMVFGGLLKS